MRMFRPMWPTLRSSTSRKQKPPGGSRDGGRASSRAADRGAAAPSGPHPDPEAGDMMLRRRRLGQAVRSHVLRLQTHGRAIREDAHGDQALSATPIAATLCAHPDSPPLPVAHHCVRLKKLLEAHGVGHTQRLTIWIGAAHIESIWNGPAWEHHTNCPSAIYMCWSRANWTP